MASVMATPFQDEARRSRLLAEVSLDAERLRSVGDSLRSDRDFVLEAVARQGTALEFSSPALREDRELVLRAVRQSGAALQYATQQLRGDQEVVEVVLEAVRKAWWTLGHAGSNIRKDPEVVLEALRQHGCALQYADTTLRSDPLVVLRALRTSNFAVSVQRLARPQNMCEDPAFKAAAKGRLASPGERAPVLLATLDWSADRSEIVCEAGLLSGLQVSCAVPHEATVADLSEALQRELSNAMDTEARRRESAYIHVQLDGRDEPLSPFDSERALAELL